MVVALSLKMMENSLRDVLARGECSYCARSFCRSYVDVLGFLSFCGCVINCDHIISDILTLERSLGSFNGLVAVLWRCTAFH